MTPKRPCQTRADFSDLLDGIDDWDTIDFLSPRKFSPQKPKKREASPKPLPYKPQTCTRCKVKTVENIVVDGRQEKVSFVKHLKDNQ